MICKQINIFHHFKVEIFFRETAGVTPTEYIVLENLTIDYNKPCILDLKMGTRHYGDFASEAKRKSQKKKSKRTTSGKLGIRFCGSQRFSYTQGNFETLDKYVGRSADESELKTLLKKFFTCGGRLRTEEMGAILEKIVDLREILLNLHQYRFYSSSLLIIYEGQPIEDADKNFEEDKADNSMDCEQFDEALAVEKNNHKENNLMQMFFFPFITESVEDRGRQQTFITFALRGVAFVSKVLLRMININMLRITLRQIISYRN